MVQVIFNDGLIYLSLKGIIDFEQEKNRLQKSLLKIEKEIKKIDIKLKSENLGTKKWSEKLSELCDTSLIVIVRVQCSSVLKKNY